jgi:hypothetical protein
MFRGEVQTAEDLVDELLLGKNVLLPEGVLFDHIDYFVTFL